MLDYEVVMMERIPYRNFDDMSKVIKRNLFKLPSDLDLIVGVPRSGMIPAYMIGLFLNKQVCSVDELILGHTDSCGERLKENLQKSISNILIVDDSICTGNAMNIVRNRISHLNGYHFYYLAIYSNGFYDNLVDFTFEKVPTPRIFQWNYMNMVWAGKSCFDLDGVLCVDPTFDENDDGEKYREFLLNAKPLFIPNFKINCIVTTRLEKYRAETEIWLEKHHIIYDELVMLNLDTQDQRKNYKAYSNYKAQVYKKRLDTIIFVESDPVQAKEIALISNKTVICSYDDEIYYGELDREQCRNIKTDFKIRTDSAEIIPDRLCYKEKVEVSVIVPVYNSQSFLQECINTIRFQTFQNIEMIFIDDGSTDQSLQILRENAKLDDRISIIEQEKSSAGNARNIGIKVAKGKYLLFLDSDDFFDLNLIEDVYNQIDSTNSDICLFKCRTFDNNTLLYENRSLELRKEYLPKESVFNSNYLNDYIFNITTGAPWSKMFRKDFILDNSITFQDIHHYNDMYFVMKSMYLAKRITYLDRAYVNYRINRKDSLQNQMFVDPLLFTVPFKALHKDLISDNKWDLYKKSFVNRFLISSIYVLLKQDSYDDFKLIYNSLKNTYFPLFDLDTFSEQDVYDKNLFLIKRKIDLFSAEEFLHNYFLRNESGDYQIKLIDDLKWKIRELEKGMDRKNEYIAFLKNNKKHIENLEYTNYCYNEVLKSKSYKIGLSITYFPRLIRRALKKV